MATSELKLSFYTVTEKDGTPVLNRHGEPFVYSSEELGKVGLRVLQKHLDRKLALKPFGEVTVKAA